MTISDIGSYVSFRTGTDTTTYSAANRLINTNRWYEKIVTMISDSMDGNDFDDLNKTDEPVSTSNLVANQQAYTFPTGIFKIKRVEVKLDGTSWLKAESIDVNMLSSATDTTSVANTFSTAAPYYDVENNMIKLYPIPASNVTAGLKIWYTREPAEFTSAEVSTGTKEPGFDEPFHIMIALGVCHDWFAAKKLWTEDQLVAAELADYEARLRKFYGSKNTDNGMSLKAAYIDYN